MEVPHSGAPGIGFWAGARGSRQVSAPDAPLNPPHLSPETHSPSFYGDREAGALDPSGWKEARASGRGAGGGGRLAFALFGVAALGAALRRRWGRGRRADDGGSSVAASSPPRPVPQDCSWHWRVGKLEGGARAEPCRASGARRLCSEPGAGL